jgi:DNA-binding NarL/FixJ family response regulator
VILLDLTMPRKSGLEAIPELKEVSPHSRILLLLNYADARTALAAIRAGVMGYLLKEIDTTDLRAAIRHAHQGVPTLHPAVARHLIRELNRPTTLAATQEPLTESEAEVLVLIAVTEIGQRLLIHEQTVYRHITAIFTKLAQGPGPSNPMEPPLPLPIPVR